VKPLMVNIEERMPGILACVSILVSSRFILMLTSLPSCVICNGYFVEGFWVERAFPALGTGSTELNV